MHLCGDYLPQNNEQMWKYQQMHYGTNLGGNRLIHTWHIKSTLHIAKDENEMI